MPRLDLGKYAGPLVTLALFVLAFAVQCGIMIAKLNALEHRVDLLYNKVLGLG